MIVCPNCNHPNPEGAVQCEACYTPLPATTSCPNCGAAIQADAAFCGQCGHNMHSAGTSATVAPEMPPAIPDLHQPHPEPVMATSSSSHSEVPPTAVTVPHQSQPEVPPAPVAVPHPGEDETAVPATTFAEPPVIPVASSTPPPPPTIPVASPTPPPPPTIPVASPAPSTASKTQLQQQSAKLLHVQTDRLIELSPTLSVVHIGKPNDRVPPDVDVSGFPNSEVVSRMHADIRVEGDAYYIEDVGSSNGTYINNSPLLPGNRHRLRTGDRIALGKGDMMTFLFQLS